MIVIPIESSTQLSINLEKLKEIEDVLSPSQGASGNNFEQEIPVVSSLDQLVEIQNSAKRMEVAKHSAYESFRNQFLEINKFVQSSNGLGSNNVLHAFYKQSTAHDGKKTQEIILYSRPRSSNLITRFFDWVLYSDQEHLAQRFLLKFLACAPTFELSNFSEGQNGSSGINKVTDNATVWIKSMRGIGQHSLGKENLSKVKCSSVYFLEIAKELRRQIEEETKETKARNDNMIECIAFEDDFFQWQPDRRNGELDAPWNSASQLPEELKIFGTEKIKAFDEFINDIKKLNSSSINPGRISRFSDFCIAWVNLFNRKDRQGDCFRNTINKNSQLRAWNVAAHYLALRDHPYIVQKEKNPYAAIIPVNSELQGYRAPFDPAIMNLQHYDDTAHVMISLSTDIYFPETAVNRQETLHAIANMDKQVPGEDKSIKFNKQVLTVCRLIDISNDINPIQEAELFSAYQKFINTAIKEKKEIILTPIFNYTENTIDRCIDAMITPIVTQRTVEAELPEIRLFSSDPRITEKFNQAIADPESYMALRAQEVAKTARATAAKHGLSQLQLQCGILPSDMNDPGMIMMHASATKYGTNSATNKILDGFTKKPLFATAASAGKAVPRKRKIRLATDTVKTRQSSNKDGQENPVYAATNEKEVMSTTHFIMPTDELRLDRSYSLTLSNLLGREELSSEQKETIRQTYIKVFSNAKENGVSSLVLVPCFDVEQCESLREEACAVMLDVLDSLLASHRGIVVKMALASQQEYAFVQQQVALWKKTANQRASKGTKSLR